MTVQIKVKLDTKAVSRYLTNVQRKQLPFATALALTTTAKDVQRAETREISKKLKNPTPFTKKAIGFKGAKKNNLTATVFVKDIQYRYLKYQILGTTRRADMVTLPVQQKLNVYGNIPGLKKKKRSWKQGSTTTKRSFVAVINGTRGVWNRARGRLNLLVAFDTEAKYQKRFRFFRVAAGVVRNRFKRNFDAALVRALRSAR